MAIGAVVHTAYHLGEIRQAFEHVMDVHTFRSDVVLLRYQPAKQER